MKKILITILLYFLILFQVGFGSHFPIYNIWINLPLLTILLIALKAKDKYLIYLSALWGGLLLDAFIYHQIGLTMVILLLLVYSVQILRRYFSFDTLLSILCYLIITMAIYELMLYMGNSLLMEFNDSMIKLVALSGLRLIIQISLNLIAFLLIWLITPFKSKEKMIHVYS